MTLTSLGSWMFAAGLAAATMGLGPGAQAQTTPPTTQSAPPARNANVYNGRAHQPSAGVQGNEAAAGVAPSDQRATQQNRDLDQMGRQLTDKANKDAASAPPPLRPPNGK